LNPPPAAKTSSIKSTTRLLSLNAKAAPAFISRDWSDLWVRAFLKSSFETVWAAFHNFKHTAQWLPEQRPFLRFAASAKGYLCCDIG
jgi:hypothetical protein